ncbi:MAG: aminotransferase class V-fold PLP-dependent enzyme [Clostridia bacterium]|nr:aminotransferase class V-fold PLP-dependent enzyme [Clostridia bacterium]MBQ1965595.1 aminotransferase class V-fold PLP-dependent enzyme [Clostridia bacterium]
MYRFACDYQEGCHPRILKALTQTNMEQTVGYGCDPYCDLARDRIKQAANAPEADVHFLMGGTQANTTVVSALLRPHQGVLTAETGHIAVHESGAIESTGHKVLPLPSTDGKLTAKQVEDAINAHYAEENHEHTVQPGMVYISHPTENGTLYTRQELYDLSRVCRAYHIPLYMDGARLAYGLAVGGTDLTLEEIASKVDVLLIGGTKCGALFGEAVMILKKELKADFRYLIKQRGGMLAKGRLLGIQFFTLFSDGLYTELADKANRQADKIRDALKKNGFPLLYETSANQIFTVFSNEILAFLSEKYAFDVWGKPDEDHTAVRICTSWATDEEQVKNLVESIKAAAV